MKALRDFTPEELERALKILEDVYPPLHFEMAMVKDEHAVQMACYESGKRAVVSEFRSALDALTRKRG